MIKLNSLKSKITCFFLLLISIYFIINTTTIILQICKAQTNNLEILLSHALHESFDYIKESGENTNLSFLYSIPHMVSVLEKSGAREIEFFFSKGQYQPKSNEISISKLLHNDIFFNIKSTTDELKKHIFNTAINYIAKHLVYLLIIGVLGVYFINKITIPLGHLAEQCRNYKDGSRFYLNEWSYSEEINQIKNSLNILTERFENLRKKDKEVFIQATHDLKTPLAIIKARVDGIDWDKYRLTRFKDEIDDDLQRLYLEIKSILYFNIFDYDKLEYLSVKNELEEIVNKCEILLKARNLSAEIVGEDFKLHIRKNLFCKMLISMFENAMIYAKEGTTLSIKIGNHTIEMSNIKGSEINLFSSKLGVKILQKLSCELGFDFEVKNSNDLYLVIINFNKKPDSSMS